MPPRRSFRDDRDVQIDLVNGRTITLGETFHKADIPWIVWSVKKFNMNTEPVHVELTMRKDPTTRITVSVDALTNHRYFRRVAAEAQ